MNHRVLCGIIGVLVTTATVYDVYIAHQQTQENKDKERHKTEHEIASNNITESENKESQKTEHKVVSNDATESENKDQQNPTSTATSPTTNQRGNFLNWMHKAIHKIDFIFL
mgnify:CR=1 FL=1